MRYRPNNMPGQPGGVTSIGHLLSVVFLAGILVASLLLYAAFLNYRNGAVREIAQADAQRISHLVFEHLYSVMRKGATQGEINDLVHHIRAQLPNYEIAILRGPVVARQFGEIPGQKEQLANDPALAATLADGMEKVEIGPHRLRHLFPLKATSECVACHTQASPGDINGLISVSVSTAALETPIAAMAYPMMFLAFGLIIALLAATYLVLRGRVSQPIMELTGHVAEISAKAEYERDLAIAPAWPVEVASLAGNFNQLMAKVRDSHRQLLDLSLRDPLTGLFNRRHFDATLEQVTDDARHGSRPFSVLLIDLDRFKAINDTWGHAAGDAVLAGVAKALQGAMREGDLAARVGGDEFAVLALASTMQQALDLAGRLRVAVGALEFRFGNQVLHGSCSIGVAAFPDSGGFASELLQAADAAMYADKRRMAAATPAEEALPPS